MYDLLKGLTVIEGAAFVAGPSCGLYFAQMGADVIRFDQIGGGPDARRWPLGPQGQSLYWEGLNKGKRSIALDLSKPEGRELAQRIAASADGLFVTQLPRRGLPVLREAVGATLRPRLPAGDGLGRRDAGGGLHRQRLGRGADDDRTQRRSAPGEPRAARLGPAGRRLRGLRPAGGGAGAALERARAGGAAGAVGPGGGQPRQPRSVGGGAAFRATTGHAAATTCSAPSAATSPAPTASG